MYLRSLANTAFGPGDGLLFNRPGGGIRATNLVIASGGRGRGRRPGAPLFGGVLEVGYPRGGGIITLTLNAYINPTRFAAHQPARHLAGVPIAEWDQGHPRLYAREPTLAVGGEVSLDGGDNILLTPASRLFDRPEAWSRQLARYWQGLLETIDDAIHAAAGPGDATVETFRPSLNLRQAETYWEFRSTDPTVLVAQLEPYLWQLGAGAETRSFDYPHGDVAAEIDGNSRSVRVQLRPGVLLKVYAKTSKRVRFEISHKLRNVRGGWRHTSSNISDLASWLEGLASDAAEHMNGALEHLELCSAVTSTQHSPSRLVRQVVTCAEGEVEADTVMSLLTENGVIRIGVRDPLQGVTRRLVKAGVLRRVGRNYVLQAEYRQAGASLRRTAPHLPAPDEVTLPQGELF
jgi:hypothetical protein